MKTKRLRIVNKFRFISFLILCFLLITALISSMFESNTAYSDSTTENNYIECTATTGDTIWEIAKNNNPYNYDIRKVVHEIMKLNSMDSADIRPGDIIKIPSH